MTFQELNGGYMNKYEFEKFLYKQIPITRQMGFSIIEFTPSKVIIAAKLVPNIKKAD